MYTLANFPFSVSIVTGGTSNRDFTLINEICEVYEDTFLG